MRFLALLRGINVGGNNLISKEELRQTFAFLGFTKVRTYIQSGNILFRSDEARSEELTGIIESELSSRFSYMARAVILSHAQYASAVQSAPVGWGNDLQYKHNALFTLTGVAPKEILAQLPVPQKGIEIITEGSGVIFWSVSKEQLTRTSFMKLPMQPAYQQVTVRNHNTVQKLLRLFEEI